MMKNDEKIMMIHGAGGSATGQLIREVFADQFDNSVLDAMEDAAVVPGAGRLAVTTDSFVVDPLEFKGGDIGRLAVCGTVNDLLMRGAEPAYLTCGFILEEGLPLDVLRRNVHSMARTAREAGVTIVAGDTKVVEGSGGMYINTSGVGFVPENRDISSRQIEEGDAILVSGYIGDHHAAILSERLEISTSIQSDCAPLSMMVRELLKAGIPVHGMRDVTRGGLATVLKEMADSCGKAFYIEEELLPVTPAVKDFCGLLGLDPLYMGNEGKLVAFVPEKDAESALEIIRRCDYGENAVRIGRVKVAETTESEGSLTLVTGLGGMRKLGIMAGEGLPRIC